MPIATHTPETVEQNEVIELEVPVLETAVLDSDALSLDKIVRHIEGGKWEVTYYSQILGSHDGVATLDPGLPDILQGYSKINDLVLHVDSSLAPEIYTAQNKMTSVGNSKYYNQIPPNIGDVFTAYLLDNRIGIFNISEVSRLSYNKETVYDIGYGLVGITSLGSSSLIDLESKVLKTYHYSLSNLMNNVSPLLTSEEYANKVSVSKSFDIISRDYVRTMLNRDTNLLIIPGQVSTIFDYYLNEFIFKVIGTDESMLLKNIGRPGITDRYIKQPTIYDALVEQDYDLLISCNRDMKPTLVSRIQGDDGVKRLSYVGVSYIVYPVNADVSTGLGSTSFVNTSTTDLESTGSNIKNINITFDNVDSDIDSIILIPTVSELDTYLFSDGFYDGTGTLSLIETLTAKYLRKETIEVKDIVKLTKSYRKWNKLEQYYYGPILLLLSKYLISKVASIY